METLVTPCGKKNNHKGKPFGSREAIDQHISMCNDIACMETYEDQQPDEMRDDPAYQLAQDIGDDMPDGAFWALYNELAGNI